MSSNGQVLLDEARFADEVLCAYAAGRGDALPCAALEARAAVPPGTAGERDLSYVASRLPAFDPSRCTGCMECVNICPDAALSAKVLPEPVVRASGRVAGRFAATAKYGKAAEKRGLAPGLFGLFLDPHRCKGCGECAEVCDEDALEMSDKDAGWVAAEREAFEAARALPPTPEGYVQKRLPPDWMLDARAQLYTGGAGSCTGCGEGSAIRLALGATGYAHGPRSAVVVAATGCNTVFGSTYPYNPFRVPWTCSLFENAPAVAMGLRARLDQQGRRDVKVWVIGGDGALFDIGFGSLSRLLASGLDVNVLVLDTQVYSNTGGQASTATFLAQDAEMAAAGSARPGKREPRKELGLLAIAHGEVFVAQSTPAHVGHFVQAVAAANEYPGPAVVLAYASCPPEHGIADDAGARQARLAVSTRAFPLLVHDPRKGDTIAGRLSLAGNPARDADWATGAGGAPPLDFVHFARSEARFAAQFDREGRPSEALLAAQADRLRNWRRLRELAGAL